ncbi:MAG: hypothetical protein AVDCRST_MAG61-2257, partial [uncultured Friedmanniella sp.]
DHARRPQPRPAPRRCVARPPGPGGPRLRGVRGTPDPTSQRRRRDRRRRDDCRLRRAAGHPCPGRGPRPPVEPRTCGGHPAGPAAARLQRPPATHHLGRAGDGSGGPDRAGLPARPSLDPGLPRPGLTDVL